MQLRVSIKNALESRNHDDLWNRLETIINKSILQDMPELCENIEVQCATNTIYRYLMNHFQKRFAITLTNGINNMDYNMLKMQINELNNGTKQYELNSKYNGLVTKAESTIIEMESINNYLIKGSNEKNMNLLSIGINKAQDISYVNNELYKKHIYFIINMVHLIVD